MFRLGRQNNTEFELSSSSMGSLIIDEPQNWRTDDKSFERADNGGGTLLKLNNVFEMGQDAADYIDAVIASEGFNAKIYLTKRGKDDTKLGEDWRIYYRNKLDPTTFVFTEKKGRRRVEASFSQGGLYDQILARYSDEYDLVNTTSADGDEISELSTIIEQVDGRALLRWSKLYVDDYDRTEISFTNGDTTNARAIPFDISTNGDEDSISSVLSGADSVPYGSGTYQIGNVGSLIYFDAPIDSTLVLNGKIKLRMIDTEDGTMKLEYVFYKLEDDDLVFQERVELTSIDTGVTLNELEYIFDEEEVVVPKGWSLAIVAFTSLDGGIGTEKISYDFLDTTLIIEQDFKYDPSQALALLPYEFFDRIIEKITGESGLLISNIFGRTELGYSQDGNWSTLAISSGFWARGFDIGDPVTDSNGDITEKKQLNISYSDAFDSFSMVNPLYWGVVTINGKEYVRIEDYDFTQQSFTGVKLGRTINGIFTYIPASNVQREPLTDELYTRLEIGYDEGGSDYEEVFGLSSPHGTAKWSTCLSELEENAYIKTSSIRADLEAYEISRAEQSTLNPDEDTSYDQDLFFRHLKKVNNTWVMRSWEDDFATEPKFIYSPETAGNLMITPYRCMLRHKKIFSTGLYLEPYKELVFISSNCNSSLEIDGVKENESILNKDLGTPYINGWVYTFEGKVFQEVIDSLEGKTYVDGEFIPNWYGVFEFMVDDTILRGRLITTTVTGNGSHEIALI